METQGSDLEFAAVYSPIAERRLNDLRAGLAEVASHDDAPEITTLAGPTERWSVPAYASFTGLAIWEHIKVCCDRRFYFEADIWGFTIAFGGVIWGTAWFDVPESRLKGDAGVQCAIVGGVAVEISWWWGNTPIGVFAGGGIGIGAASVGGKGQFVMSSC